MSCYKTTTLHVVSHPTSEIESEKTTTSVYLSLQLKIIRCFKATTGSHSLFILIRMLLISNKMNLSQNWPMQM